MSERAAPVRVLIAPDKFRGTLSAREAAEAMGRGWLRSRQADEVDLLPLADGGEGTLQVLVGPEDEVCRVRVHGPLGDPLDAELALTRDVGLIETARASGLGLLSEHRRDPTRASSRGTGELMAAALDAGARSILVGIGGSATNDGGVGMATALGARFADTLDRPLRDGPRTLVDLASIDLSGMDPRLAGVSVIGMADVDNPLTGPNGASAVFGPQKGASPEDVAMTDRALGHLATVVRRDLGVDVRAELGAGAGGGLGFGLMAFCGARLRRGIEVVMEKTRFIDRVSAAGLVITGEGSLDEQSLRGKVVAGVLREARLAGRPAAILTGRATVAPHGATVRSMVARFGEERAMHDASHALEDLAAELASDWA
ncbi:MAG: glycerate kinase family protein [Actinomycetota bacterium]